MTAGLLTRRLL